MHSAYRVKADGLGAFSCRRRIERARKYELRYSTVRLRGEETSFCGRVLYVCRWDSKTNSSFRTGEYFVGRGGWDVHSYRLGLVGLRYLPELEALLAVGCFALGPPAAYGVLGGP